jgi:hypothetical protein
MDDNAPTLGERGRTADDRANDPADDRDQVDRAQVVRVLGELASRPLDQRLSDQMRRGPSKTSRRPRRPMLRQLVRGVTTVSPRLQPLTALTTVTVVSRP